MWLFDLNHMEMAALLFSETTESLVDVQLAKTDMDEQISSSARVWGGALQQAIWFVIIATHDDAHIIIHLHSSFLISVAW